MQITNGLYGVHFYNGTVDAGSGTVVIKNGTVNGGDYGFSYQGRIENSEGKNSAEIKVHGLINIHRWKQEATPVIPGLVDYNMEVSGVYNQQSNSFELQGKVSSVNVTLRISCARIANLTE